MSMPYGPKTFRDAVDGVRTPKAKTNGFKAFITVNYKAARASTRPRASTATAAHLYQAAAAPSLWLPDTDNAGRLPAPIKSTKHRSVNFKASPLKAAGRTNTARQQSPQPSIVTLADFVQLAARRSASSRSSSDRSIPRQASGSSGGASPSPAAAAVAPTLVKAASWAAAARAPAAVSASPPRSKKAAPKTSKAVPSKTKGVKTFKLSSATEFPSLRA